MSPLLRTVVSLSLLQLCAATAWAREPTIVLLGATVFDGTGAEALPDATVVLEGDQIRAIGPRDRVRVPRRAQVVDCEGRYVVPGLIDTHVHFFQSASLYTRPDIIDLNRLRSYASEQERLQETLLDTFARYLASGVTAVVDVGGPFSNFDLRDAAETAAAAPRVAVAGPLISTVSRPQLDLGDPPIIKADSPEHARELARAQIERDPDLLKLWFILDPEQGIAPGLPIVEAVVDEAHRAGVRVAVHATQLETARAAVEAGVDVLVHSIDDADLDPAFVQLLLDEDVILTPTLVVYEGYAEVLGGHPELMDVERRLGDPWVMHSWDELHVAGLSPEELAKNRAREDRLRGRAPQMAANLAALHRAGVPIAAGTDAGNIGTLHGPSLHRELELMVQAGLAPRDVLLSATRDAARLFAEDPDFGTLEPGKRADLLVLDADPLADVANLQRIHRVVSRGELMDPERLVAPTAAVVVQRQVEAYGARDLEGFLATYAQDVQIWRHPSGELVAEGLDAMRETYGTLFEDSPDLAIHIAQRIELGEFVIDHEVVAGLRGGEPVRAVAIYQVRDGLIQAVWFLPRP